MIPSALRGVPASVICARQGRKGNFSYVLALDSSPEQSLDASVSLFGSASIGRRNAVDGTPDGPQVGREPPPPFSVNAIPGPGSPSASPPPFLASDGGGGETGTAGPVLSTWGCGVAIPAILGDSDVCLGEQQLRLSFANGHKWQNYYQEPWLKAEKLVRPAQHLTGVGGGELTSPRSKMRNGSSTLVSERRRGGWRQSGKRARLNSPVRSYDPGAVLTGRDGQTPSIHASYIRLAVIWA